MNTYRAMVTLKHANRAPLVHRCCNTNHTNPTAAARCGMRAFRAYTRPYVGRGGTLVPPLAASYAVEKLGNGSTWTAVTW